jgi:16S rRNA (cytosine967-C5)-methyltransferase
MNVRKEAYKIIYKVLNKNLFSDKLIKQVKKKLSREEEKMLYVLVKGVIKMSRNLDYIIRQYADENRYHQTNLKIRVLLYMGLYEIKCCDSIPEHASVNETVDLAKELYGENVANFINAILRAYLRAPDVSFPEDPIERIALEHSFPTELVEIWTDYWGTENTELLCMYFNDTPRLSIRVNNIATSKKKLMNYFSRRDIKLKESPACKDILTSQQAFEVLNDVAMSEGYYSVQDCAAALVVELLDPHPDQSVLDLFAAPGGKATYIAECMKNTGEVIAVDKIPNKVKQMKQAMERLQLINMRLITEDSFNYGPQAPAFDRVLLDVPCSNWGVLQKKAELRWQTNQDMGSILKLQENALKTGAVFVKPGGYLIYSTCTMNRAENEEQVENFLEKHKDFVLADAAQWIPKKYLDNNYLKIIPYIHNMDGSFAAKMKKKI